MESLKIIDNEVFNCDRCGNLVEKFMNTSTVYLGKDNNLVIIGEAPANNGWRKSQMLWKNPEGKILPSGVVLQKLFAIINRDIFETTFLEAVKCYPQNRKDLKVCSKNCKHIMLQQLAILKPKIIITLGEAPTRILLNIEFKRFSDVVGKVFDTQDYKVIPIYHPNPISPLSYKGNIPIFEKIKELI